MVTNCACQETDFFCQDCYFDEWYSRCFRFDADTHIHGLTVGGKLEEVCNIEYLVENYSRHAYLNGLIRGKGLGKFRGDIVDGMNKSCRALPSDILWCDVPLEERSRRIRIDGESLSSFAVNYIARWQMYDGLFKNFQR